MDSWGALRRFFFISDLKVKISIQEKKELLITIISRVVIYLFLPPVEVISSLGFCFFASLILTVCQELGTNKLLFSFEHISQQKSLNKNQQGPSIPLRSRLKQPFEECPLAA